MFVFRYHQSTNNLTIVDAKEFEFGNTLLEMFSRKEMGYNTLQIKHKLEMSMILRMTIADSKTN
jgi:hypothetical protein